MPRHILSVLFAVALAANSGSDTRPPQGLSGPGTEGKETESLDEGIEAAPRASAVDGGPVAPGAAFPAMQLAVLPPGSVVPGSLDLGTLLGKQPVVFFYFRIGNALSEEIYLEVQDFVEKEVAGKVALYPVTFLGSGFEVSELHERMRLLGIERPVILDEEARIQRALKLRFVPTLVLINSHGELSFTGARSLMHPVRGELTARDAILMASKGERPPAREIWRHYPASDLIGTPFHRLALPRYDTGATLQIADYVEPGKVTAILYWSPRCQNSKTVMPGVVIAQKTFGKQLNLISVVRDGSNDEVRAFAEGQGIDFPIARNKDSRFSTKYRIISTPTLITIAPDGRIDDVFTSGKVNLFAVLRARIEQLVLKPPPTPATAPSSG